MPAYGTGAFLRSNKGTGKRMKKQDFPIMKKTCLLQAIYELVHMLFSLFAAHGLSEITEGIQGAAVREAIDRKSVV